MRLRSVRARFLPTGVWSCIEFLASDACVAQTCCVAMSLRALVSYGRGSGSSHNAFSIVHGSSYNAFSIVHDVSADMHVHYFVLASLLRGRMALLGVPQVWCQSDERCAFQIVCKRSAFGMTTKPPIYGLASIQGQQTCRDT